MVTLDEIARYLDISSASLAENVSLDGIAPPDRAGPRDLAFVSEPRFLKALNNCNAGCVILKEEWREQSPVPVLCVPDPYLAYARVSALFDPLRKPAMGMHPSAFADPSASVSSTASVGAGASVEAGAVLEDNVIVGAGCHVGHGARLGAGTRLWPGVVIYHGVILGKRCVVHANSVIGSDGFGFARGPEGWEKISQLGAVRIGDDVDIGSGVTIDRGALDDTVIADGVIIDNQVHIAHNCTIGSRTAIAGCVGMAGSVEIGADCTFAGQVGISGHLKICDNAHLTGQARVTRSISEPGTYASGTPLETSRQWGRNAVRFGQLDAMHKRLAELEAKLEALGGTVSEDD